jgi:hypothetical protein
MISIRSHAAYHIPNEDHILVDTFHQTGLEIWNHLQEHSEDSVFTPLPWNFDKVERRKTNEISVIDLLCRKRILRFIRLLAKTENAIRQ